jgi:uncharacterized protein (UPF0276 family)
VSTLIALIRRFGAKPDKKIVDRSSGEPEFMEDAFHCNSDGLVVGVDRFWVVCPACPYTLLRRLPLGQVAAVHLSGGRWVDGPSGARRLLDDHLHDVPPAVFELLRELGRLAPQPLTVIIERDGRYPPTARLLEQLDDARAALAAGREVGP